MEELDREHLDQMGLIETLDVFKYDVNAIEYGHELTINRNIGCI